MKTIQTLWCGDRELKYSAFWWNNAEYNLMSWALSCMSIKEQSEKITLYADSQGARVLADKLKLPYDEVIVNLDDFHCLSCHWALAKVKTYSLQTEPFIHIDGDIFLPRPLSEEVLKGRIIAQNKEQCTEYYGGMIKRFLSIENLKLSPLFEQALRGNNIPSYNLGFCGGRDTEFFGRFCEEVFRFFKDNDFNGDRFRFSDISANVIFEQIFFSVMARHEGIDISTVYPETIRDNGYTRNDFCDLTHYEQKQFIHILGGHKRTQEICDMVETTLLRKYPDAYERIAELFPERHKRLFGIAVDTGYTREPSALDNYYVFLRDCNRIWRGIDRACLMTVAINISKKINFINASEEKRKQSVLRRNPYLCIYSAAENETVLLRKHLNINTEDDNLNVAVVPDVSEKGFAEHPLDNLSYNILDILEVPLTYEDLEKSLLPCFDKNTCSEKITACIEKALVGCLYAGLVTAEQ